MSRQPSLSERVRKERVYTEQERAHKERLALYAHDPLLRISERGWQWVAPTWAKLAGWVGLGGVLAAGLTLFYAAKIEPRWVEYTVRRLRLRGLPSAFNGYRIVQLSDLHLAEGKPLTPERLAGIIQKVNRLRPDLIMITGDFVTGFDPTTYDGIRKLARLHAPDGVWGILGNHDYWVDPVTVTRAVSAAGVRILKNEHAVLRRRGDSLVIAGLDDIWEGIVDLDQTLRGAPDAPVILMAHEPNYADHACRDNRVVLQLSGHSHGGQVRIPGLGPLALPDQSWRYPMGLYTVANMLLYVSRGLGMSEIPLRCFCRPEVTTFILEAERS